MTVSIQELVDELNFVAESANITAEFTVVDSRTVGFLDATYLVDPSWAMGNAKRLPDRCKPAQMVQALQASHPDVKGLGPKLPSRE